MPIKLDCHNVSISVRPVVMLADEHARIPDNLATLTQTVIALHRANGDLGWLADMCHDAEQDERPDRIESAGRVIEAEHNAEMSGAIER